jgi:Ca2+-binding EF-hand superfamily protein
MDEGTLLMLNFRHFDTNKSGDVCLGEFKRTLENFGCFFAEADIIALFNHYDADGSGKLSYDEFCNGFAIKGSGGRH